MTKASKTTIIVLLLAAILAAGGIAAYVAARRIVPTVLSANIESILSDTTGQPVAIGKTAVRFFPGIIITIRNVTVGTQAKPLMSAHRVVMRLSLWHALFGRVRISHVDLNDPIIHTDYEALRKFKLKEESGEAPPVEIHNGVINLPGREGRLVIESINGLIEHDGATLDAMVLGGKTRLKATHSDTGWKGSLSSSEMDLAHISPTLGGVFGVHLNFDLSGNRTASALSIIGERLRLPWTAREIPTFMVRLGAKGNDQALSFDEISVMTPLVKVTGSGVIRDIMKGTGATVALNLKSSMFEYEKVLAFLPVKDFDPWLTELLTAQVKGGMSRFPEARYEGTIQELITFDKFLDHIHVVEDIMGQSFASRPGMERVTGITGSAVFSHGNIFLRNLHGHMRDSVLNRLDISFPGIMRPYWVVDVGIALDMKTHDFFDTWNAAGVPRYVVDLFSDISRVQAGRVRGQARFYWDQSTGRPVQAKGRVDLEHCAYMWGTQAVTAHSGSVVWAEYGSPMEITSKAAIGSHEVKSLSIVMADPFGTMQSTFAASVEGIVTADDFSMGKGTTALIKGTATGLNIKAAADISSESISLFDTVFRMKDRPITLTARIKGPLAPKLSLSFTGEATGISPGSFAMTGSFDGQQTRVTLKGGLPLNKFEVVQAKKALPLSGRIYTELDINSAKSTSVNGSLVFRNALVSLKGTTLKIGGRVNMVGSMLSGERIKVAKDTLKFAAHNWSLDLSGKPVFKGDVAIDGLSLPLPKGESGAPKGFNEFSAEGHMTVTNLDFYGNLVENAQADVYLRGGVANLTSIRLQGKSVQATGTAVLDAASVRSFDSEFSFKGVNITRFLENISPDQDWIHGNMDIDGRLYGTPASLNGKVKLVAKNGKLKRYALFSRVFAVLNVYKIIKNRDFELTSKNFPYNRIDWTFTIKDNLLHFDDMFFDSNSLQFSAVGDYNLNTRVMDVIMGIQPFETIDKVIHSIPLIGWVLTGDKGQFLIVSLKVKGNINDPSVQVQPWKTVSDPVKNSLVRALKLPAEMYKDSRNFLSGGKDKKNAAE